MKIIAAVLNSLRAPREIIGPENHYYLSEETKFLPPVMTEQMVAKKNRGGTWDLYRDTWNPLTDQRPPRMDMPVALPPLPPSRTQIACDLKMSEAFDKVRQSEESPKNHSIPRSQIALLEAMGMNVGETYVLEQKKPLQSRQYWGNLMHLAQE